jgi:hypothetical protein
MNFYKAFSGKWETRFDFIFLWLSGFKAKLYMSQKRKSHGKSELLLSDSMLAHFFKKK